MSGLRRQAEQLHRISQSIRADPQRDPAQRLHTQMANAVYYLEGSVADVREALREGDRELACRRLMNSWMWFGEATALRGILLADEEVNQKIRCAANDLRRVEREYHAARGRARE